MFIQALIEAGYRGPFSGEWESVTTGWRLVTLDLGTLAAGSHTLIVGGYNSKKTATDESTNLLIDDVTVLSVFPGGAQQQAAAIERTRRGNRM